MSLVEELMADLEDEEEDLEIPEVKQEEDEMETEDVKPTKLELEQIPKGHTIFDVAQLHKSPDLQEIMNKIEKFSKQVRKPHELLGTVEADPEYILIVDANDLAAQIDNELSIIHKVGLTNTSLNLLTVKCFSLLEISTPRDFLSWRV